VRVALASGDSGRAQKLAALAHSNLEFSKVSALEIILARTHNAAGRFGEALPIAEKAVSMWSARQGGFEHSYQVGRALLEVASAYAGLGNLEAARKAAAKAADHTLATAGPNSPATLRVEALRRQLAGK
jgi:hypothetical protein